MEAVEFETTIQNRTIELPKAYSDFDFRSVRVILLAKEPKATPSDAVAELINNPVNIDFKPFSRDEANAR